MKKIYYIFIFIFILSLHPQLTLARGHSGLRVTPRNIEGLKKSIESRENNSLKEIENMDETTKEVYKNQNRFKNSLGNLMIMENMLGPKGYDVVEICSDLSESFDKTVKLEILFKSRSKIMKFFFGQKEKIIDSFSAEIDLRKRKISELKKLLEQTHIDQDLTLVYQEQLLRIEEEENRMEDYFNKEVKRKGVVTWLLNIFK